MAVEVRLAEIVATLSLATDLGFGQPMEHGMRSCVIALRLGERLGLKAAELATVYYVSPLAWVGCSVDAHEQARIYGDDIALKAATFDVDFAGLELKRFMVGRVGADDALPHRAARRAAFIARGHREAEQMFVTHCAVTSKLAASLGLGADVQEGLQHVYERGDGRGRSSGLAGEQVMIAARLMRLARAAEVFHRTAGTKAAIEVVQERRGGEFDRGSSTCSARSRRRCWTRSPARRPGRRCSPSNRCPRTCSPTRDSMACWRRSRTSST